MPDMPECAMFDRWCQLMVAKSPSSNLSTDMTSQLKKNQQSKALSTCAACTHTANGEGRLAYYCGEDGGGSSSGLPSMLMYFHSTCYIVALHAVQALHAHCTLPSSSEWSTEIENLSPSLLVSKLERWAYFLPQKMLSCSALKVAHAREYQGSAASRVHPAHGNLWHCGGLARTYAPPTSALLSLSAAEYAGTVAVVILFGIASIGVKTCVTMLSMWWKVQVREV
eukprot:970073-Pelagomonas_calceolata.AAC.6